MPRAPTHTKGVDIFFVTHAGLQPEHLWYCCYILHILKAQLYAVGSTLCDKHSEHQAFIPPFRGSGNEATIYKYGE